MANGESFDPSDPNALPPAPTTKEALLEACDKFHNEFVETYAAMSAESLAKNQPMFSIGEIPAISFMKWYLRHLIHHRGELQVYLRVMGAKCPSIYGPTQDVGMEEVLAQMKQAMNQ